MIQVLLQDVTDLKLKEQKLRLLTIHRRADECLQLTASVGHGGDALDHFREDLRFEISIVSLDVDHFKKVNDT